MRGKRSGKRFSERTKTGFLVFLAVVTFTFCARASGNQTDSPLSRLPRQILSEPSGAVQDGRSNSPNGRAEALLSFNMVPMKTLWLGACMGLIYCLRRTKKA
jgi:hypothetical protein